MREIQVNNTKKIQQKWYKPPILRFAECIAILCILVRLVCLSLAYTLAWMRRYRLRPGKCQGSRLRRHHCGLAPAQVDFVLVRVDDVHPHRVQAVAAVKNTDGVLAVGYV